MNKNWLILVLLLCGLVVSSQDTGERRWGSWFMYFGTNALSDKFSLHTEAQFRYFEMADNFNQLLLRTGGNYHITDEAIATLGYAYIATDGTFEEFPDEENTRENRIFQQFILRNRLSKWLFEHRYRLEQRFIDFRDRKETQHRARYRLQITYPISELFFINWYDEIFLNLQDDVFGQNRFYIALGMQLSKSSSVQVGYLKNHFPGINYDRLQFAIFFNPDLRTRKSTDQL